MAMTARVRTFGVTLATVSFAACVCGFPWRSATARPSSRDASSTTVIGSNALLSDGASALRAGRAQEGLRLTLAGLGQAASPHDLAAGHANACAALAMLQQWQEALEHCNQAIQLDSSNWRAFNNRAAIYVAKGLYDLAISDIETGLTLAPNSRILLESMRVARHNKRIMEARGRRSVPS
jgi:tetratricopeptide (TPR) repeat protein